MSRKTAPRDGERNLNRPEHNVYIHRWIGNQGKNRGSGIQSNNRADKHLGNDTTHNVFAAEVEAIAMAGKMIMELETNQRYKRCMIFVDSQAAITVVEKAKRQSGQEAIKSVLDNIESIKLQNPKMEMRIV